MNERVYYSNRVNPKKLTLYELYERLCSLYLYFRERDFFKGEAEITKSSLPDEIQTKARLDLGFNAFPITKWGEEDISEERIFDALEFLHDHASAPGEWTAMTTETGWNYHDYDSYDISEGRRQFRDKANSFLKNYGDGYEITDKGEILRLGRDGVHLLYDAEIVPFDEENVDRKVRTAIRKWRDRHLDLSERKAAILELADVFEWLKKTKELEAVLNRKDQSDIFEIANKFGIRHHDPKQIRSYDEAIWYSWMFHFYLATYHAVIRLIIKERNGV